MKYLKKILLFLFIVFVLDYLIAGLLLFGINRFYGLNQHSQILLIGHSHLMLAVDKEKLEKQTGLSVSKYTREGVTVEDKYVMVKQFLSLPYSDSLQIVMYGVDAFTFSTGDLSENSYTLFFPFMENKIMNNYIRENATSAYNYWIHKIFRTSRYSDALINAAGRGLLSNWSNFKYGTVDVNQVNRNREIVIDPQTLSIFKETIDLITARGIKVVLVNTPIVDIMIESQLEQYQEVVDIFSGLSKNNPLIEYWDFNHPPYSTDYSLFFDGIHLNPKGQMIITEKIISRINQLNDKNIYD